MKEGIFPTLGASSSVGFFSLPPAYYYLSYPFILISLHPAMQVLPNSLSSFVTIFLFAYVVYRFLPANYRADKRLLISGFGAFLLSINFSIFSLSVGGWNPNPIPMFLLLIVLICDMILKNSSTIVKILLWSGLGISIGIMLGLHSTTFFVMPAFFIIFSAYLLYKNPKNIFFIFISIFFILITLAPYAKGELNRNFKNTKNLREQILLGTGDISPIERYKRALFYQKGTNNIAFFANVNSNSIPVIYYVLASIPFLFAAKAYRIQRNMTITFSIIWLLFIIIGTSYMGDVGSHYLLLGIFLPMLFILSGLITKKNNYVYALVVIYLFVSIIVNLIYFYNFFKRESTSPKRVSINEKISILNSVPKDVAICGKFNGANSDDLAYIDKYVLKNNRVFRITCVYGDYKISPSFELPTKGFKVLKIENKYSIYQKI
jgi:hypothetical protein